MTEPKKTRTRRPAAPKVEGMEPVQFVEPEVLTLSDAENRVFDEMEAELDALEPATERFEVDEDARPVLSSQGLVRENEVARNSRSVRAVQVALLDAGHWAVGADPAGYWGRHTQAAAVADTGEEDPVAAARALGFTVI